MRQSFYKALLGAACFLAVAAYAQPPAGGGGRGGGGRGGRGGGGGAAQNARTSAAIDMTGYWVALVTEDWRYRMVTPPKGSYGGVPMNGEGRRVAAEWDPAKDEAAGAQCKSYGAAALMRVPGRLHITWDNDTTMKIETDAGTQTRVFHFAAQGAAAPADSAPSWQGYSVAEWENAAVARGAPRTGDLKVVTTRMLPGYLRKNGVPYSGNAVLTEYYDRITAPNKDQWLVVTTEVKDPQYLSTPFTTTTHFKLMADASGWDPQPCSAK
jgi:hypothetical protein